MTKKTEIKSGDDNKKNTRGNQRDKNPVTAKEKIKQTTMKRRNDGTTSKTETRTETKTTTLGVRGEQKTSSTTKTSTKTTSEKPAGRETKKSEQTTTTKTTTTRTSGEGDGSATKTETGKKLRKVLFLYLI